MAISTDYPHPVTVNGFSCRNCTDVDYAKRHIDPAHPHSGPYNIDAKTDPSQPAAVRFAGRLSGLNDAVPAPAGKAPDSPGNRLDITA